MSKARPRARIRPAVVVMTILVLAAVAVPAKRMGEAAPTAGTETDRQARERIADSLIAVPQPLVSTPAATEAPQPPAGVEPGTPASDGVLCEPGARPVLNTVRPVLSARMATSVPVSFEITRLGATGYVGYDAGEMTVRDGFLTLYLRGPSRLQPGETYRWRIRDEAADVWSPPCEFTIAERTTDSLDLDDDRPVTVSMPTPAWRYIAGVLGPGRPHGDTPLFWSIEAAAARAPAGAVPVSLRGWDWGTVIDAMAEAASARDDQGLWRLVDALSEQVGGPPHPTLGYPRDHR